MWNLRLLYRERRLFSSGPNELISVLGACALDEDTHGGQAPFHSEREPCKLRAALPLCTPRPDVDRSGLSNHARSPLARILHKTMIDRSYHGGRLLTACGGPRNARPMAWACAGMLTGRCWTSITHAKKESSTWHCVKPAGMNTTKPLWWLRLMRRIPSIALSALFRPLLPPVTIVGAESLAMESRPMG